jgi:nucleotide-binding universal stress UspA family protein
MFRTIVVGTDGSDTAFGAVVAAAELAALVGEGATLHIVSVVKPAPVSAIAAGEIAAAAPAGADLDWQDTARHDLESRLAGIRDRLAAPGVAIETHVRTGNPAEVLCELAGHLVADLIVVGNRGMQGGRRFLGSVPNTVSHHAPCSVLIVDTVDAGHHHDHADSGD